MEEKLLLEIEALEYRHATMTRITRMTLDHIAKRVDSQAAFGLLTGTDLPASLKVFNLYKLRQLYEYVLEHEVDHGGSLCDTLG